MGYVKSDGTWVHSENTVPAVASAARTASGNSGTSTEAGARHTLRNVLLDVTAASGTGPTLDARVETSRDGTTWYTAGTFGQKTGVSSERKSFSGLDRYIRFAWTIGGTTPSFTFSITPGELV